MTVVIEVSRVVLVAAWMVTTAAVEVEVLVAWLTSIEHALEMTEV